MHHSNTWRRDGIGLPLWQWGGSPPRCSPLWSAWRLLRWRWPGWCQTRSSLQGPAWEGNTLRPGHALDAQAKVFKSQRRERDSKEIFFSFMKGGRHCCSDFVIFPHLDGQEKCCICSTGQTCGATATPWIRLKLMHVCLKPKKIKALQTFQTTLSAWKFSWIVVLWLYVMSTCLHGKQSL